MVDITSIQTLDHKLSWVPEVLTHFECLFIYVFCREVFSNTAVISVTQFGFVNTIIEQIVNIDVVYIPLNLLRLFVVFVLMIFLLIFFIRARIVACIF